MDRQDLDIDDAIKENRRDAGRSGEEIERFTVDENLTELERANLFLSTGAHQLQQCCALESLPRIFHDYKGAANRALFPAFTSWVESYSPQSQVAAGEAFMAVSEDTSLPKEVGQWLLPTVLQMLNSNRNQEVARVWLKTLCAIIQTLPRQVILEDLMPLAVSKGESQQSAQSRTAACAIFGAIAPFLKAEEIGKNFLQKAMGLCQDTDLEVRVCMCEQLNKISRAVGVDTVKEKVLPELYELLKDEELAVQNAALETLVEMLDFLPAEIRQTKIMPYLRSFCPPEETEVVLISLPRLIGELMCKLVYDLSDDDFQPLMEAYKSYARHSSEEIRKLCASNIPAVLKAIGSRKYALGLHVLYLQFVQDHSPPVRAICAAAFNEIAKMLGKKRTSSYLKEPLVMLLEDESLDVQKAILEDLHLTLGHFNVGTAQQKAAVYEALLPSVLRAEKAASIGRQWRLQLCLLRAFAEMPEYFTSDQIYDNLVPICFNYMTEGVLPVRAAATMALAVFIRNNRKAHQRYELSTRVVRDYANGRSYWLRMVFIEFCENMLKVSSSRMFKDVFLDPAISTLQQVELIGSVGFSSAYLVRIGYSPQYNKSFFISGNGQRSFTLILAHSSALDPLSASGFGCLLIIHGHSGGEMLRNQEPSSGLGYRMAEDPVPSVRMRACLLLPHIKHAIKLPEDVGVLEKINHLTTQRLNDNVKEVAAAAQRVADGFKHSLRSAINDRDLASGQAISQDEIERIDKQREEEEWNMLSKEEQEEKKKIDDMLQRLKLEGGSKKANTANSLQPLSSSQQDSGRRPAVGLPRSNSSNGSRGSLGSTATTTPSRTGSADTGRKLASSSPISPNQTPPPALSVKRGSTQAVSAPAASKPGGRTSLNTGTGVGAAAASARPASPAISLRPQTPSTPIPTDDLASRRNLKTLPGRRTSSSNG